MYLLKVLSNLNYFKQNCNNKRCCSNNDKQVNKTKLVDLPLYTWWVIRLKLPLRNNNNLLFEPNLQRTISSSNFKTQESGNVKRLKSTTLGTLYNVNFKNLLSINNQNSLPKLNFFFRLIFSFLLGFSLNILNLTFSKSLHLHDLIFYLLSLCAFPDHKLDYYSIMFSPTNPSSKIRLFLS